MNREQWACHLIHAVMRSARGRPERLHELAQTLADLDTAHDVLVGAGVGSYDDSLLELVEELVNSEREHTPL